MALISSKLLLAVFSFFPYKTYAQNMWLYPDPKTSPTYNYIDILNASWSTTYDSPNLILWCTANAGGAYGQSKLLGPIHFSARRRSDGRIEYNQSVPPIGNRLLHLNFSETAPQGCHFNIGAQKNVAKNNLNSGNFNIQIESSSSTVTWSPTNPTSSATSSSITGSATSQTTSPTASTSPPPPRRRKAASGLSPAAKAGIGIGAAAGVVALVSGLLFWLRNRKKWRLTQLGKFDDSMQKQPGYQASEMTASDTHAVPVETDGRMLDHGMSGNPIAQAKFVTELDGSGTTGETIGTAR